MAPPWDGVALLAGVALLMRARRRRCRGTHPWSYTWSYGLDRLSLRAAEDAPSVLHTTVGKKALQNTISWHLTHRGEGATVKLLDALKDLGFGWATRAGVSLGVEDLCVPPAKAEICKSTWQRTQEAEAQFENGQITVVEKFLKVTSEWTKASEKVKDEAISNLSDNNPKNPVYMMATSGARGNVSQVRQLIAMRGLMADANGELIEVPISHCLRDGLTVTDMLVSSHGARKGVVDTALRTADSGYLYRRLDFAGTRLVIRAEDCGTQECMDISLHGSFQPVTPLEDRIRGRVLAESICDPETGELLFQRGHLLTFGDAQRVARRWRACDKSGLTELRPIRVRSAFTCKLQEGLCSRCYGEDLSKPGKLVSVGLPVGTVAAQSMGEPGTQLTMRTFHTGGAFEGGAGKGAMAASAGIVNLTSELGVPIVAPASQDDKAADRFGKWLRTPQGDIACSLACNAELELTADNKVLQKEELQPGTLLKIQDGQAVSKGQGLFERDAGLAGQSAEADDQLKVVPKPVISEADGEVVVADAGRRGCLQPGAKVVWVLEGNSVDLETGGCCSLTVRSGDVLAPGAALAVEWARVSCTGVPRFQRATHGSRAGAGAAGQAPALGWRHADWRPRHPEAGGIMEEGGPAKQFEAQVPTGQERRLSLRTDFDWFFLTGELREYQVTCKMPAMLAVSSDPDEPDPERLRMIPMADKPTTTSVYTFLQKQEDPADAELPAGSSGVGVVCAAASSMDNAGVVCPVSRIAHPEHVVPLGGLVFHLPPEASREGHRSLLWVPEEVHNLQISASTFYELLRHHNKPIQAGKTVPEPPLSIISSNHRPVLEASVAGCFQLSLLALEKGGRPLEAAPVVASEPNGVLRREERLRVRCPGPQARAEPAPELCSVECAVKPGHVFACPSELLDESWYAVSAEFEQGLLFHQKAVPPGVPIVPGLPMLSEHWRVVEVLDDPRAGPVCKVLVRMARLIDVPVDPEPKHPLHTKTLTSWHLLFAHGELVRSQHPVALAHEVVCSVNRHPQETHCVTVAPVEQPPPRPATASSAKSLASITGSPSLSLNVVNEWPLEDICVVQHSPLGTPQRTTCSEMWSEPCPKYMSRMAAETRDRGPGSTELAGQIVPRRQLLSPGAGYVCQAKAARPGEPNSVVILRLGDCARVPCRARPFVEVGALLQVGEALSEEDQAPLPGQVLLVEEARGVGHDAPFFVTLRRGRAYLVTDAKDVRVQTGNMVQQGDVLGTEDLVVQRTADIVQGLPRINSLFEAHGGVLQSRLDGLWKRMRKAKGELEAAKAACRRLQQDLVAEIQSVYLEQGVAINSKHIELIVLRMTEKCEVLDSGGLSLKKGTLVTYREVEALHALCPSAGFRIRPRVRGVTRTGLDNHVMTALGFREADNVLTTEVLHGQARYPLRGIKENAMFSKPIDLNGREAQAEQLWGTVPGRNIRESLNLEVVPEWGSVGMLGDLMVSDDNCL